MAKFDTFEEARDSIAANKWAATRWDKEKQAAVTTTFGESKTYLDDYARVAAFLCNETAFKDALTAVSKAVWTEYVALDETLRNRFSRALGKVAAAKGFSFQNRMALDTSGTAPIGVRLIAGDPQLGYMLRNALFWKDSMDSRHGEHTHSLQWLAVAEGAATVTPAHLLYRKSADFHAPSQNDSKGARSLVMWRWLADCFPNDMSKFATEKFLNGETLQSHSARAPQWIMDLLLIGKPAEKAQAFLAAYLFARYRNRGWLAYDSTKKEVTDIQVKDIKPHRESERATQGWAPSPSSPKARLVRDATAYANSGNHTTPAKQRWKFSFHGVEGHMSFHYVDK